MNHITSTPTVRVQGPKPLEADHLQGSMNLDLNSLPFPDDPGDDILLGSVQGHEGFQGVQAQLPDLNVDIGDEMLQMYKGKFTLYVKFVTLLLAHLHSFLYICMFVVFGYEAQGHVLPDLNEGVDPFELNGH